MKSRTWVGPVVMAAMLIGGALGAAAQGRGRGHGEDRGNKGDDQGRARIEFSGHDRDAVRVWEREHDREDERPIGFRDRDRLTPALESELRVGVVLAPGLRRRMHAVPRGLLVTLEPAPERERYVVIGDHICLVDRADRVAAVLHLELNF